MENAVSADIPTGRMVVTGGACVLTFYLLYGWMTTMPLVLAALAGAAIITAYEFAVGMIVNVQLGWQVWDYSQIPGKYSGTDLPAVYRSLVCGMLFILCSCENHVWWQRVNIRNLLLER